MVRNLEREQQLTPLFKLVDHTPSWSEGRYFQNEKRGDQRSLDLRSEFESAVYFLFLISCFKRGSSSYREILCIFPVVIPPHRVPLIVVQCLVHRVLFRVLFPFRHHHLFFQCSSLEPPSSSLRFGEWPQTRPCPLARASYSRRHQ